MRRREALLSLPPPEPVPPESPAEPVKPPSVSEVIAQRVLNNSSIKLGVGRAILNDTPAPATIGASGARANEGVGSNAFGARGTSGADPVHVVIDERESVCEHAQLRI